MFSHNAKGFVQNLFHDKKGTEKYTGTEDDNTDMDGVDENSPYFLVPRRRVQTQTISEEVEDEQRKIHEAIAQMMADGQRFRRETSILSEVDINHFLVPGFYFILGAFLATPSLALKYFAIRVLDIRPSAFGLLYGVAVFPWFLKSIWGRWSDSRPLFGRHRVPYLLICSVLCMLTWIALAIPGIHSRSMLGFGVLIVLTNFFTCFADVIVDCLVARDAREEMNTDNKGKSQSRAWAMRHSGSLIGIVFGAYLVANVESFHSVFAWTSVFPAILFVGSLFLVEEKHRQPFKQEEPKSIKVEFREAMEEVRGLGPDVWNLAKFIVLFGATPNSGLTFSYYLIQHLHFSEKFMGFLSIVAVLAMLAGLGTYTFFLRQKPSQQVMRIAIIIGTVLGLLPLALVTHTNEKFGLDNHLFSVGDDITEAYASQIAQMPILIAIASVCPTGSEGFVYSGLISLSNFAGALATWGGAALTHIFDIHKDHYDNMWALVLVCTALNIVPIFYVHWIPTRGDKHEIISMPLVVEKNEPHRVLA